MDSAKAVVSISEMARMVGLSRARFYQLIGTAVPWPVYDVATRRPFYDEELQQVCLEVRRRNVGIDGKAILFYSRRTDGAPMPKPKKAIKPPKDDRHDDLLDGLRSLGLTTATTAQVVEAVKELYPHGVDGTNHGEVLRTVFLHLRRRNTGDNVGG
jgi:hypothetical protein